MDLATAKEFRDTAKSAYLKAITGEQYSVSAGNANRNIKRQPLEKLRSEFERWQAEVDRIESPSKRNVKFIIPRY